METKGSPAILVDLDMVITDFHGGFEATWKKLYPERNTVLLKDRQSFYLTKDYSEEYKDDIESIINDAGFLRTLHPLPGAIEGFKELIQKYPETRICTTLLKNKFSASEKWEWVRDYIGQAHAERMIVCNDKTWVRGDYLIDDRPEITGAMEPTWIHILFDQPYNKERTGRRFSWGKQLPVI